MQLASAQNVQVQVPHRLSAFFSAIDDKSIPSFRQAFILGYARGGEHQMAHGVLVPRGQFTQAADVLLGYEQNMGRGLGVNIPEGQEVFIVVNFRTWYFPSNDIAEKTGTHGGPLSSSSDGSDCYWFRLTHASTGPQVLQQAPAANKFAEQVGVLSSWVILLEVHILMSAPRILVIGYNAFDVTVPFEGQAIADTKNEVDFIGLGGGGPGATAAMAMARLGAQVKLVTPLTDDLPGLMQEQELRAAAIDLEHCPRYSGHESAKAVILVDKNQEHRTIFWSRGDLPRIAAEEVQTDWLVGHDLLYHDGHEFSAAWKFAQAAQEKGMPVVMDAGSVREGSQPLVAASSDVISSEKFAPDLTGCSGHVEALEEMQKMGPRNVAMTFGAGGMLALVRGKPLAIAAYDQPVVDTTGAGDVFHAGYAFARAAGKDFQQCLQFGAAAAVLKCRTWGGRPGLPDLAEVNNVLENSPERPLDPRIAPFRAE